MPRKARDERLDTRAARLRLPVRREPYWRHFQEGRAIGYRRISGGKAGTWIARYYDPSGERLRKFQSVGSADDLLDADGFSTLTFIQAQEAARVWFSELSRSTGRNVNPMTMKEAMTSYVADYKARGGKDIKGLETTIRAHIIPKLGDRSLSDLSAAVTRTWRRSLATAARRVRVGKIPKGAPKAVAEDDLEGQRARRASANRILTVLKAGLNLAYRDGHVRTDEAWRRTSPFKNAEAARIRYLTDAEAVRLINAAGENFRPVITAALLTGARYGELVRFQAADFDSEAGTLHVRVSKTGKQRHIMLTDEGVRFYRQQCIGKTGATLILTRSDGRSWAKSEQMRPMRAACAAAKIEPAIGFHILRHTYASRLTMAGVPLGAVAAQLGNGEAICAKHYAHLSPNYVADSVRAAFRPLGVVPSSAFVA